MEYYYTSMLTLKYVKFIGEILENDSYLMCSYEFNYIMGSGQGHIDIYEKINTEYRLSNRKAAKEKAALRRSFLYCLFRWILADLHDLLPRDKHHANFLLFG